MTTSEGLAAATAPRLILERLMLAVAREGLVPQAAWVDGAYRARVGAAEVSAQIVGPLGFGRYQTIVQLETRDARGTARELRDPRELLEILRPLLAPRFGAHRVDRLDDELASSVEHLALGLEALERRRKAGGGQSLWDWWTGLGSRDARRRALEGLVVTGHRVHPCTKTRLGMTTQEAREYAPEVATGPVGGTLVGLHRSCASGESAQADAAWERAWPAGTAQARRTLAERGHDPDAYALLPVHPWQRAHVLPELVRRLPPGALQLDLEGAAAFWPQASLRTVEPTGAGGAPLHAKLALGVHTTSAERTISPQSVLNGPRVSTLLATLVRDHEIPVEIIEETAASGVSPACVAGGDEWARQLGAIARANPSWHPASTAAWPHTLAAAWPSPSPVGPGSLLAGWIAHHAGPDPGARATLSQRFFGRLCTAVVRPVAALVARFGVGLEAHAQNLLVDLDAEGLPCGAAIRDFGGIRIALPRLAHAGYALNLAAGSALQAEGMEDALAKFAHCVLQSLVPDFLEALEEAAGSPLGDPWGEVRRALEAAWSAPGADPSHLAWLLRPTAPIKCLTTMRLEDRVRHYTFRPAPNPLWRPA